MNMKEQIEYNIKRRDELAATRCKPLVVGARQAKRAAEDAKRETRLAYERWVKELGDDAHRAHMTAKRAQVAAESAAEDATYRLLQGVLEEL